MNENSFDKVVVIQAYDTTEDCMDSICNLCVSKAMDNGRGITLFDKEKVCDYISLILSEVTKESEITKEDVMGALDKVLMTYKPCMVGDIYMLRLDYGLPMF